MINKKGQHGNYYPFAIMLIITFLLSFIFYETSVGFNLGNDTPTGLLKSVIDNLSLIKAGSNIVFGVFFGVLGLGFIPKMIDSFFNYTITSLYGLSLIPDIILIPFTILFIGGFIWTGVKLFLP